VLSREEKDKIIEAFKIALPLGGYIQPDEIYGEIIEDRESQISFSALGQLAPVHLKKVWDPDGARRLEIKKFLDEGCRTKLKAVVGAEIIVKKEAKETPSKESNPGAHPK